MDYGFRVVISPRFGDIFRGNSGKAGLLAAQVDEKVVQRLWDHLDDNPGGLITVDLESRTVRAGDGVDAIEDSFDIDDYTRWRLLEGLDDIGITLGHDDDIAAFEAQRPSFKPRRFTPDCEARTRLRQHAKVLDFPSPLGKSRHLSMTSRITHRCGMRRRRTAPRRSSVRSCASRAIQTP